MVDALYLADSPDTAWAEWYRWLAEHGLPPSKALPRHLWEIGVELDPVLDLRSPEALAEMGLGVPRPTRDEWPRFQSVGERVAAEGYQALAAPSAAHEGGEVLCVFWPPEHPAAVVVRGEGLLVAEPPAPPRGLRT